ncbi:MAG: TolC family protein [Sphingobacteriales bacterium]|nr:MAG: TolC family protein [Sphingobacteriales bacterium]
MFKQLQFVPITIFYIILIRVINLPKLKLRLLQIIYCCQFNICLVWNVFDHGRLKNQVMVEDARFQQLYEQYQESVLSAAREVDDSAVAFARSTVQITLLDQSVEAARRSLEIATIQYREGLVDFQRVLDSQKTLFNQQERLVTSRGEVTQSLIALYKAMGGGWQSGRGRTLLDEATRTTMRDRSDWKNLVDAPLPAASTKRRMR